MSHFLHLSIFVITSMSLGGISYANINKCIDNKTKKVTFTDSKCRSSESASSLNIVPNTIDNSQERKVVENLTVQNIEHVPHFISLGANEK